MRSLSVPKPNKGFQFGRLCEVHYKTLCSSVHSVNLMMLIVTLCVGELIIWCSSNALQRPVQIWQFFLGDFHIVFFFFLRFLYLYRQIPLYPLRKEVSGFFFFFFSFSIKTNALLYYILRLVDTEYRPRFKRRVRETALLTVLWKLSSSLNCEILHACSSLMWPTNDYTELGLRRTATIKVKAVVLH